MNVVLVYQYYQDHSAPGHSLIYELAHYLAARGHTVTVVAGESGYMKTSAPSQRWYRRIRRVEQDGDVRVVRTYAYTGLHRSYPARLLGFLSFTLSCPLGFIGSARPDVVFATSPPLFPVFSAWLVCAIRRIPFVTEVRDLWPESAVQMGLLKNRQLIGIMRWMERILYDHSKKIVALTTGIRADICARGWSPMKVEAITCGVDEQRLRPDAAAGKALRQRQGWHRKKIVMYFGALGEANNLPVILRASQRLRDRADIHFVLVGDGMKRVETQQWVERNAARNVIVLAPVAKESACEYLNAADICLVTLKDLPLFEGAIPTKLIDYMACGKPVLCGVRGEAKAILEQAEAGIAFEPDDDEQLSRLIPALLHDAPRAATMGSHGRAYVEQHFSAAKQRAKMESLLVQLVRNNVSGGEL
jgi:glycosyltransferase involved in cell wall biosynthesis